MSTRANTKGLVVLAVDDEPRSLDEIAYLLQNNPRVGRVLTAFDAAEALRVLHGAGAGARGEVGGGVDVVFADISMPGLSGMELARVLQALEEPPELVFVTGFQEQAIEAFEVGALDYILKPPRAERVERVLKRIEQLRGGAGGGQAESRDDEVIPVELAGTTRLVPRSSVRWVEAQGDYARLHTAEGSHLVRIPLSQLEESWADAGFVRIHRSFLVALPLITELRMGSSGYTVRLGNGPDAVELPVSRRHTRELKDRLVRSPRRAWGQGR
ncbi:MAG TPA: LytTR family DNA-binding domain-containing protein [Pseudonocardiaceae bacterium]